MDIYERGEWPVSATVVGVGLSFVWGEVERGPNTSTTTHAIHTHIHTHIISIYLLLQLKEAAGERGIIVAQREQRGRHPSVSLLLLLRLLLLGVVYPTCVYDWQGMYVYTINK